MSSRIRIVGSAFAAKYKELQLNLSFYKTGGESSDPSGTIKLLFASSTYIINIFLDFGCSVRLGCRKAEVFIGLCIP